MQPALPALAPALAGLPPLAAVGHLLPQELIAARAERLALAAGETLLALAQGTLGWVLEALQVSMRPALLALATEARPGREAPS